MSFAGILFYFQSAFVGILFRSFRIHTWNLQVFAADLINRRKIASKKLISGVGIRFCKSNEKPIYQCICCDGWPFFMP